MLQVIQAFGLTSTSRKARPPAVDDVSFEARAGRITVLLGAAGAGKTTALRLMLALRSGRGITYFRGRPLYRIAHPAREVGVLLGDVPGHPARSVRGHLRMLCAASGVPVRRADEVLEAVGLVSFREERLGTLSRGMDRRLGLACALLPDPHTLVLDDPVRGLSPGEAQWLHGMLRAHADQGGTVLTTTGDPREAARIADRVVTLDAGRLVADQEAGEFARTRLRPRVAVRSPYAVRLAAALTKEARTGRRSVEVVREGGNRLSVYGTTTAVIGETAFRHGILVHELADELGDMGPGSAAGALPERAPTPGGPAGGRTPPERAKAVFGFSAPDPPATTGAEHTASASSTRRPPRPGSPGVPAPSAVPAATTPTERTGAPRRAEPRVAVDAGTAARRPGKPEAGPARLIHTRVIPTRVAATGISALRALLPGAGGPFARQPWSVGFGARTGRDDEGTRSLDGSPLPPPVSVRPAPTPLRPLRYEIRRATGVGTGFLVCGAVLVLSVLTAVALAGIGHTPRERLFAAWPRE
ncbi:ATP-binding cassette domain-containing protein, partial [Streptomyces malaysiense]|uniref:ABC transporter ATP-binding protein n=1 Tax=Streptomyces malaysiense TaxID=1428626 RepID=UPI003B8469E2